MTYDDLLKITHERKAKAVRELNEALKGPAGFLAKADIERSPGTVAYFWLAKEFCETLAEHIDEFIDQVGMDSIEAREMSDIYMAWYDDDPDLYELLPVEAQLFTEE